MLSVLSCDLGRTPQPLRSKWDDIDLRDSDFTAVLMLFVAAGDISITNPVSIMGEKRSLAFEKFRGKQRIFLPVSSCELWKLCHRQL